MQVGFIGLGIMGKPMCRNLLKNNVDLTVFDINHQAVEQLASEGAKTAASCCEIAEKCDVIITMLPNSPHVREALLGEQGVIKTVKEGTIVVDMSSIDPLQSREIGKLLAEKGVKMLDAPVSGGEPKAVDATLSVMVGGEKAVFETCLPLLNMMAASVVLVGDLGAGNIAKLANQMIVGINIAAVSEALVMSKKLGASPEKVFQAIRGGLAGSTVMDAKVPMMLSRNFDPGFRIELHIKDLTNALNAAHGCASPAPLTASVMEFMSALKTDGLEKQDHSSLVKFYEKIAGVVLEG